VKQDRREGLINGKKMTEASENIIDAIKQEWINLKKKNQSKILPNEQVV
jgi:hypothetical protein